MLHTTAQAYGMVFCSKDTDTCTRRYDTGTGMTLPSAKLTKADVRASEVTVALTVYPACKANIGLQSPLFEWNSP